MTAACRTVRPFQQTLQGLQWPQEQQGPQRMQARLSSQDCWQWLARFYLRKGTFYFSLTAFVYLATLVCLRFY